MIPHPEQPYNDLPVLPPLLEQVETLTIIKQERTAAVALAELKGIAKTLPNSLILVNAIILREAQASSEIENIITTHDNLYQALVANTSSPDHATKEVLRYREALMHGFHELKDNGFIHTNAICRIQAILEENEAGIRKIAGTKLRQGSTGKVIYTPPDDQAVLQNLMRNFEAYINDKGKELPVLIKMAIQHYQFESIHPFYDGNGRTGRIINVLYLILQRSLETPILYLSGYIITHKRDYYRSLRKVQEKNDWEEWILFMLKGVETTAQRTTAQIEKLLSLFQETQTKVQQKLPRIYSKDLVELLFIHPYIKAEFITNALGVERKTSSRYLKNLVSIGLLEHKPIGRENIYINKRLYKLLKSF